MKRLVMQLPPEVYFQEKENLILWKPNGILDEKKVNQILSFIGGHERVLEANELRFTDTTGLTEVELNFRYVFHVALYRRLSRAGKAEIKSAVWATGEPISHYFKMHALLTDRSALHVKIFQKRKDAAEWLNVSEELLQVK